MFCLKCRFFFALLLIFLLNVHSKAFILNETESIVKVSSSVWCHKANYNFKCTFTNICYNPEMNFMFMLSGKSVLSGLNAREDLMNLHTSPVLNNTAFFMKLNILDEDFVSNAAFINDVVYIMYRFKPDNIMHVIHDDLLPLFATYKEICYGNVHKCASQFTLGFIDNYYSGPFTEWYAAFSNGQPLYFSLFNMNQNYCFAEVHVGLSLETLFFQYGYNEGRGAFNNKFFNGKLLSDYSEYMLRYFNVSRTDDIFRKIIFINRKVNRKILNSNFIENVIFDVAKDFNYSRFKILNIDILSNTTVDILSAVANSFCLLGMHGSGMILSMFLPENSRVIELFPYGIQKETVSPVFILSKMININFNYFSWGNSDVLLSFPHPEYPALLGGVRSFQQLRKIQIINNWKSDDSITRCCHNANFLYNMYHDTVIDDSIIPILQTAFKNQYGHSSRSPTKNIQFKQWFFPSDTRNITCYLQNISLLITWKPPLNVKLHYNCVYHLTALSILRSITVSTRSTFVYLRINHLRPNNETVQVWITCECDGIYGMEAYGICS